MSALRVLVVDPDQDNRESLALLLRVWGHEVLAAEDGPSALELSRTFEPHVVFTELLLPGLDGWDLAQRLQDGQPLLVAVTVAGREQDRARSIGVGFAFHLCKPADPKQLEHLLSAAAARQGDSSTAGASLAHPFRFPASLTTCPLYLWNSPNRCLVRCYPVTSCCHKMVGLIEFP